MDIFAGFVDSPKLYITAMRLTFLFSTPLFIFAVYVIITASLSEPSLYKWFPLYQVCLYYISDILAGPGLTPILYLPLLGGYPAGALRYFGIPSTIFLGASYVIYFCKALSVAMLFYIRYDAILPRHYPIKPNRSCIFALFGAHHLTIVILTPIVLYNIVPDQAVVKRRVLQDYPSAPPSISLPEALFIEAPFGASLLIVLVYLVPPLLIVSSSTYTVSHSLYYLRKQKVSLSSKALAMQRAILYGTIAEVRR
ncbi:hypothetical protein Q1695_009727 [Nippostrongylus brasiliensis]|nr:hypothetical protein Q1695_009727 [Nippostrongylus brasiliensis]